MIPFAYLILGLIAIGFAIRVLLHRTGMVFIVRKWWSFFEDLFHVCQAFKVPEFDDTNMQENHLHRKVIEYLNSLTSIEDSDFANLVTGKKSNDIVVRLDPNQTIEDRFLGAKLVWVCENGGLTLRIRKADKRRILRPYLQYIHEVADEFEQRKKETRLYMNVDGRWRSTQFSHPSTFETIAMETDLKSKIKSDLENFLKSKQYYHRLGRVWKRSFLLYGPSGTGKTSFVAAMANFLGYDVYDLDLSKIRDDADLRTILLHTTAKSVIVIEDLDWFLAGKSTAVTSAGVLSFMDGLTSSSCTEERIMVFTTTRKDGIDPAILRPGRVDVHIHFPLCDFMAFKNLASNYLGVKEHKLFPQVEEIFQSGSSLSPAEIGELMLANRVSPSRAIKSVITALQTDGAGKFSRKFGDFTPTPTRSYVDESSEPVGFFEATRPGKDLRKLVGLLRMKSNRKSDAYDAGLGLGHG